MYFKEDTTKLENVLPNDHQLAKLEKLEGLQEGLQDIIFF